MRSIGLHSNSVESKMCRVNPHISASARPQGDSDVWHVNFNTKTKQRCHNKRKLQANIPDENKDKNPRQNIMKLNSEMHEEDHSLWWGGTYFRDASIIQHLINVIYHKVKNKNHHLSRCKKSIWKNTTFICDDSQQSGFRGKVLYDKLTASVILNNERLKTFPLRSGIKQRCQFSLLLFNGVLEALEQLG